MYGRTYQFLLSLTLLALLVCSPTWLVRHWTRQERLDAALIAAVENNDAPMVKVLLRQGADPNTIYTRKRSDKIGWFSWVLSLQRYRPYFDGYPDGASRMPVLCLVALVDDQGTGAAESLINAGADVNAADDYGGTALMDAAGMGNLELVRLLLGHNAEVNLQQQGGETALTLARYTTDGFVLAREKQGSGKRKDGSERAEEIRRLLRQAAQKEQPSP